MCEQCRQATEALELEIGEVVGVRMLVILKGDENIYDVNLHEGAEAVCKLVIAKLNSESPLELTKVGSMVPEDKVQELLDSGAKLVKINVPVDEPEESDGTIH